MSGGFLIVRRGGALWGLPADEVSAVERTGGAPGAAAFEVCFAGGRRLAVDSVLTLAEELRTRPVSARLRHFLPPGAAGLAMLTGEPLVLMAREGEVAHV